MTIGVKYCGGCNPYYDRFNGIEEIKKGLKGHIFMPYEPNNSFDAVIVVCGCSAACARIDFKEEKTIYITQKSDIREAIKALQSINDEGGFK